MCLRPEKNSAIFRPSRVDTMPVVKTPGASGEVFVLNDPVVLEKLQDLDGRIVVVEHVAIGSLANQFIEDGQNALCRI